MEIISHKDSILNSKFKEEIGEINSNFNFPQKEDIPNIISKEKDNIKSFKLPQINNIILLTFDNEVGQIVDKEFPKNSLDKSVLKVISFKGFPETNQILQEGDLGYIFKVRTNSKYSLKCHLIGDHTFLFCSVLFIQIKSKSIKRGYFQKSIVITSNFLNKYVIFKLLYILKNASVVNQGELSYDYIEKFFNYYNNLVNIVEKGISKEDSSKYLKSFDIIINYLNQLSTGDFIPKNNLINSPKKPQNIGEMGKPIETYIDGIEKDNDNEKNINISSKKNISLDVINNNDYINKNIIIPLRNNNNQDSILPRKFTGENKSINEIDKITTIKDFSEIITTSVYEKQLIETGYNSDRNEKEKSFVTNKLNNDMIIDNVISKTSSSKKEYEPSENGKYNNNFYKLDFDWSTSIKLGMKPIQFNNFFEVFSLFYVAKLWQIWELIILEFPILVFADDASRVSNIVFLLESITYPLPLNSDVRPYFSIYDPDFKEYKEETELRHHNSAILGVINPIFMKLIPDWPVVLRFDEHFFYNDLKTKVPDSPLNQPLSCKLTSYYDSKIKKSSTLYEVKKYMKKPRNFSLIGHAQIISLFLDCLKSQGESCYERLNHHLRAHFSELTRDFIKTIEDFVLLHEIREIKRITLQKKDFSIFEIFNKEKFLNYLKDKCDQNAFYYKYIHDKKKLINLYSDFLKTKCFRNHMNYLLKQIKNEM